MSTQSSPGFAVGEADTYTWMGDPRYVSTGPDQDSDQVAEQVQRAIDAEMANLGVRRAVSGDEPRFLVDARVMVQLRIENRDPYFGMYAAKKYEEATLRIELYDAATRGRGWLGEGRQRLRYVSATIGGFDPDFVPTDERRVWRIDDIVARVLAKMPRK